MGRWHAGEPCWSNTQGQNSEQPQVSRVTTVKESGKKRMISNVESSTTRIKNKTEFHCRTTGRRERGKKLNHRRLWKRKKISLLWKGSCKGEDSPRRVERGGKGGGKQGRGGGEK